MTGPPMRVIARVYIDGAQTHEETLTITDEEQIDVQALALARRQLAAVNPEVPYMIELEFPDFAEGDRFYRVGTDKRAMVHPVLLGTITPEKSH
jgi:hypothetical protein